MANKYPRTTRDGRAVVRISPRFLSNATVTALCAAIWATAPTVAHRAEQARPVHIRIDDYPRPVAAAIRQVEQHFRWVVTYEDTRYLHPDDIVDVTEQVRRDPARPGRIFQMRNGSIDLRFTPAADAVEFQVGEVLEALLAHSTGRGNTGEFRVQRASGGYHVVPVATRGPTGVRQAYSSPLDTRISLELRNETALELFFRLAAAIAESSGFRVQPGTIPLNRLEQTRVAIGAQSEIARDVLWRALQSVGQDLSWQMFCDVGEHGLCAINLHSVRTPDPG